MRKEHVYSSDKLMKISSYLTAVTIFVMGLLDAFAVIKYDELISAQTGNLVEMSTKLFTEDWLDVYRNFLVFFTFALGVFLGKVVKEKLKGNRRKYQFYLLLQSAVLLVMAFVQGHMIRDVMVFFLAVLAGYNLALFRYFRKTEVNNGIMTGNLKDLMSKLYEVVFDPDEKSEQNFADLFAVIVIFVAGIFTGSFLVSVNQRLVLWTAFFLIASPFLYLLFENVTEGKRE